MGPFPSGDGAKLLQFVACAAAVQQVHACSPLARQPDGSTPTSAAPWPCLLADPLSPSTDSSPSHTAPLPRATVVIFSHQSGGRPDGSHRIQPPSARGAANPLHDVPPANLPRGSPGTRSDRHGPDHVAEARVLAPSPFLPFGVLQCTEAVLQCTSTPMLQPPNLRKNLVHFGWTPL
ncbi:uncharacterized protein [Triticum aestivum]|uniref:uncharacterized protein n=1 Tax=Triticum aestivum TaxID=4565 RepID=UPI001D003F31|nr:uncharacterized protein LOC123065263 [Triticum aestivum]